MGDLFVVPLCLGHIIRDKSLFTLHEGMGEKVTLPIVAYYIGGAEATILVDTGTSPPHETAPVHLPYSQQSDETLHANVKKLGLEPDDIEIVINTHLHWDHCHGNKIFPHAKFYVQREELRYAAAPPPLHAFGYDSQNVGLKPPFANVPFEFLQGDREIVPGVSVVLTPGHTPGSQGVLVECKGGPVFIAGDTLPLSENWGGTKEHPYPRPNGVYTDLENYYRTFDRIAEIAREANYILPGHDPSVFMKQRYPETS